jgi:DNA-binding NtrC family response regulator
MSRKKLYTVIIDSHLEWHDNIKTQVSKHKHLYIESCYNASEFLYRLPHNPDIVIMDCEWMEMHPLKLMQAIKEFNHETLLIMISAQENIDLVKEHAEHIHIEYVEKTDHFFEDLDALIEDYVNQKFHLYLKMDEAIERRTELLQRFKDDLDKFINDKNASAILEEFWNSKKEAR